MKHTLQRLFKLRKALVVCSMLVSAGQEAARVMAYMFDICRCGGLSKTAWGGKHIAHNARKFMQCLHELNYEIQS